MAVNSFAGHCGERAIVYDCMDELSQFKNAPPELIHRERQLLRVADVVFCGGRKMREKRLPLNANCHFYGTGVDCIHFGRALSHELAVDPDIAALPQPILGYFGVIDERIDYALLEKLADACSDCSIVMVGPIAKVDPAELPRRANLHWLGGRPYAKLPGLTKGFAVCMMPFALNAATEYINPTKALEYMAAGRPVVSTALDEVKSNFASESRIAASHEEFIALCRAEAMHETHHRPVFQPAPVVNYPNEYAYTRITEFKYLTGQEHPLTSIVYEFPKAEGDPYYPIPRPANALIYKQYQALAAETPDVHFVGRLATYRYYNMDQVVGQALTLYKKLSGAQRMDALAVA